MKLISFQSIIDKHEAEQRKWRGNMFDDYTIAKVVHGAIRAYNNVLGDVTLDFQDTAASTVEGIREVRDGTLRDPAAQHASWLKWKEEEGWKYGQTKSATLKTHPCIMPYEDLPEEQKRKDVLFRAIVDALSKPGLT